MPRNKVPGKPKGRTTAYAFFVQACRDLLRKLHTGQSVVFAEFSRSCAQRWKAMSAQEKVPFQNQALADKQRFNAEMKTYVPQPSSETMKGGKKKRNRDPNAPKRPLSAFFWFCHDERPKVRDMNPDSKVSELAKELGRMWAGVDPQGRKMYLIMAERDKLRYQRDMEIYKNNKKTDALMQQQQQQYKAEESEEESDEVDDRKIT